MLNCNENSTNAESGETLNLDEDLLYDVNEYGESGLVSDPIESIVSWLDATMVSDWPVLVTVTSARFTAFRSGADSWTIRVFEGSGPEQEVYRYNVDQVSVKP